MLPFQIIWKGSPGEFLSVWRIVTYGAFNLTLKRFISVVARISAFLTFGTMFILPAAPAFSDTGYAALDTPAIAVKDPAGVVFVAAARAGNRLVAVGEHGAISYSDDNGQSWKQASVPVDLTLVAVKFATPEDGWAVGHYGVILHTADGGVTWKLQMDGIQENKLALAAAQTAVATNNPSVATPLALRRAARFISAGPDQPFLSLLVSDVDNVTAVGAYRMVAKTTDGGKTWVDTSLSIGEQYSNNLYDIAAVGSDIYVVGETGLVFRSTDGGVTFPAVTPGGSSTLFAVVPTGDGAVFVCGVAGEAAYSEDHGKTWQSENFPTAANLTSAYVLRSGAIVVGSEDGGLFISHDHAKTFGRVTLAQSMGIFGVTQANDGNVILVGDGGVVVVPAAAVQ